MRPRLAFGRQRQSRNCGVRSSSASIAIRRSHPDRRQWSPLHHRHTQRRQLVSTWKRLAWISLRGGDRVAPKPGRRALSVMSRSHPLCGEPFDPLLKRRPNCSRAKSPMNRSPARPKNDRSRLNPSRPRPCFRVRVPFRRASSRCAFPPQSSFQLQSFTQFSNLISYRDARTPVVNTTPSVSISERIRVKVAIGLCAYRWKLDTFQLSGDG